MSTRDLVHAYFDACTRGDLEGIRASFCDDAVVYDTTHRPVRGAEGIAAFYVKVRQRWGQAAWYVDTFVGDAQAAAIEWTMLVPHRGKTCAVRGSEHYTFRDGRIAQIRQYWTFDPEQVETGLRDFPYAGDPRFAPVEGKRS